MTCPLHPEGAYGCQHCNQQARARSSARASELVALRAELAALKATHAAELRAVAERQREACVDALKYESCLCAKHVRATPLVTEEK